MPNEIELSDKKIIDLFGNEAAESESIERLKEYFYKNRAYERFNEELPLRILVGPKGTGKSAIFRYALSEAKDQSLPYFNLTEDSWPTIGDCDEREATINWVNSICSFIVQKFDASSFVHVDENFIRNFGSKFVPYIIELISNNSTALETSKTFLGERVFDVVTSDKKLTIFIDNVDSLWSGRVSDVHHICGLMRACHLLSSDSSGIKIRISLRSDVYNTLLGELDIMDKISSNIIKMKWTNHEILCVASARLARYNNQDFDWESNIREIDELSQEQIFTEFFSGIFEKRYYGVGKWENIPMRRAILSFVRQRPRDMILLCSSAAREAGRTPINHNHVQSILSQYGSDRINDLIAEYKHEMPNIKGLLFNMKPTKSEIKAGIFSRYKHNQIIAKLNDIISSSDIRFRGRHSKASSTELLKFLHRINFLIATQEEASGFIKRRYFEDDENIIRNIESGKWDWEVHMAYRWGLEGINHDLSFENYEPYIA